MEELEVLFEKTLSNLKEAETRSPKEKGEILGKLSSFRGALIKAIHDISDSLAKDVAKGLKDPEVSKEALLAYKTALAFIPDKLYENKREVVNNVEVFIAKTKQ